jgi:hypothetical protein
VYEYSYYECNIFGSNFGIPSSVFDPSQSDSLCSVEGIRNACPVTPSCPLACSFVATVWDGNVVHMLAHTNLSQKSRRQSAPCRYPSSTQKSKHWHTVPGYCRTEQGSSYFVPLGLDRCANLFSERGSHKTDAIGRSNCSYIRCKLPHVVRQDAVW